MSINLASIKDALSRFDCPLSLDYPAVGEMCSMEDDLEGKEVKEDNAHRLYFFRKPDIEAVIRAGQPNPNNRNRFKGNVTSPAGELFALTLAVAVGAGHLQKLKGDGNNANLQAFLDEKEKYEEALKLGNTILEKLKAAPGSTLKEKITAAKLKEITGTPGEMNFLEKALHLDLKNLKPVDAEVAAIERIDIPAIRPPLEVQRDRKARVLAEIRASQYVGLGYPLERNLKNGQPSSSNERRAIRAIKDIYDPQIALETLKDVLSLASVEKNVSCITVALVSKILGSYLERECTIETINKALDLLLENARKIPKWSAVKEDSLRPYIQVLEQLSVPVIALQNQEKICQFMIALHRLKTEMLNVHNVNYITACSKNTNFHVFPQKTACAIT